jgi:hypothetical protein
VKRIVVESDTESDGDKSKSTNKRIKMDFNNKENCHPNSNNSSMVSNENITNEKSSNAQNTLGQQVRYFIHEFIREV